MIQIINSRVCLSKWNATSHQLYADFMRNANDFFGASLTKSCLDMSSLSFSVIIFLRNNDKMFFDDREKSSFALLSLIIKKQHLTEKSHEYECLSIKSIFFFWKQQQNRTNGCSLIMSDSDTLIVKILPFLKENVSFFSSFHFDYLNRTHLSLSTAINFSIMLFNSRKELINYWINSVFSWLLGI